MKYFFNNLLHLFIFLSINTLFSKPLVLVSIPPQKEFVKRIAKDKVEVSVLLGGGASPHSYEPSPKKIVEISKARIWFTTGVEFERALLDKVKNISSDIIIFDTTRGVKYRNLEEHSHKDEEEHKGKTLDPHIWLGYESVKVQLKNILDGLVSVLPEEKTHFERNYNDYISEIDSVFKKLGKKLLPYRGKVVFVYHPAFGYFFDVFGIKQKAVEVNGKEPSQKDIVRVINEAKKENVRVIFVQKQFSKVAAEKIAQAIGGRVVQIDPLAENWLSNIEYIGNEIAKALE